jgi:uncharacterized NAD(P)/FAD-binding protein YdhS
MSMDEAAKVLAASGPLPRRIGGRTPAPERVIAVVGAGFSGTMAAIHLRRTLPSDHVVYLFDRSGRFARGPAYAQTDAPHLLNVRSVNMSALPDDPSHFERWLSARAQSWPAEVRVTEAGTFATRRLYGRYLRALLYEEMTLSGGRVRLCADEVTHLTPTQGGWRMRCARREVTVDAVVLAAGNTPSGRSSDGVVCYDPWTAAASERLRPDQPVLIVGTGLTMVDLALGMHARGFSGPIIALSRRGLVPQPHAKPNAAWPAPSNISVGRTSLVTLLRQVRHEVREAVRQGVDWRAVIDGLRPVTSMIWQRLPLEERSRFLRHLRPYWDSHRHRMAPGVAAAYASLVARGVLALRRGRIKKIEILDIPQGRVAQVEIQRRGSVCTEALVVQRVIYATGVGAAAAEDGLIGGLVASGLARADRHGMGLDVTGTLKVVDRDGRPVPHLWALGPLVRGVFWECTAVPDIRVQAQEISVQISAQITVQLVG